MHVEIKSVNTTSSRHSKRVWAALTEAWIASAALVFFYLRILESHTGQRLIGVIRARLGL